MVQTTIILSVAALILFLINLKKTGRHIEGLKSGFKQFIQIVPVILAAFIMAGFIEVLIPKEFVRNWLSKEAGIKGVLLGTLGGAVMAMGPYAFFPIVASVMASGAGLGTIISMITGWALMSLSKMPYETAFIGADFYVKKLFYSIPLSLTAGLIAFLLELIIL